MQTLAYTSLLTEGDPQFGPTPEPETEVGAGQSSPAGPGRRTAGLRAHA